MRRLGFVLTAMLALASLLVPAPVGAQDDAAGVTGAAEAVFPAGATFNGIRLSGLALGQGVVIGWDGTAAGQFIAVFQGTSLLGAPQEVSVEGEVREGYVAGGGSVSFSGAATVDLGDGTVPLLGVPFTVTVSAGSLALLLDAVALPTASITTGSITVK